MAHSTRFTGRASVLVDRRRLFTERRRRHSLAYRSLSGQPLEVTHATLTERILEMYDADLVYATTPFTAEARPTKFPARRTWL